MFRWVLDHRDKRAATKLGEESFEPNGRRSGAQHGNPLRQPEAALIYGLEIMGKAMQDDVLANVLGRYGRDVPQDCGGFGMWRGLLQL